MFVFEKIRGFAVSFLSLCFCMVSFHAMAATITESPASVAVGGAVTVNFSGITSPTLIDWIAVYPAGANKYSLKAWVRTNSCSMTEGANLVTKGTCQFKLVSTDYNTKVETPLPAGKYFFRLFSNSSPWNELAVSNAFDVTGATPQNPTMLSVSESTVAAGGAVTVAFANIASPAKEDWIGIAAVGALDSTIGNNWIYATSCAKTPGTATSFGKCSFPVPSTLTKGTYELRLYSNGTWDRLAVSNPFTVTAVVTPPTISVVPTSIVAGKTVTATFSNVIAPTMYDWIGLYLQNTADTAYIKFIYGGSCSTTPSVARDAYSCSLMIPDNATSGTYELRLFANNNYSRLATSNPITVTAVTPTPPTPPTTASIAVSPTTIVPFVTKPITISFTNPNPSPTDWWGLFPQQADNSRPYLSARTDCYGFSNTSSRAVEKGECVWKYGISRYPSGTYELRLFRLINNNTAVERKAVSSPFTIQ